GGGGEDAGDAVAQRLRGIELGHLGIRVESQAAGREQTQTRAADAGGQKGTATDGETHTAILSDAYRWPRLSHRVGRKRPAGQTHGPSQPSAAPRRAGGPAKRRRYGRGRRTDQGPAHPAPADGGIPPGERQGRG